MFAVLVVAAVAIGAVGYAWYSNQRAQAVKQQRASLSAIASLKAGQIEQWRTERLQDGHLFSDDYVENSSFAALFEGRRSDMTTVSATEWLSTTTGNAGYSAGWIVGAGGSDRLSATTATLSAASRAVAGTLLESAGSVEPTLTDFYLGADGRPYIDLIAPLRTAPSKSSARPLAGAIILRADPARILYPLIQTWPTPSTTAETLLFERSGASVLYLNELRHRADTALKLRLPDNPALAAGAALRGILVGDFVDYRNVPVVSAAQKVVTSPWMVIAKVDRTEAYGALDSAGITTLLIALGLFALVGGVVILLWTVQQSRARVSLLVADARYGQVMQAANDAILVVDRDHLIIEANEGATRIFGRDQAALRSESLETVVVPQERQRLDDAIAALGAGESATFDARAEGADGQDIWTEMSLRRVPAADEERILVVARDVTERRRATDELRSSEERYERLFNSMLEGYAYCRIIRDAEGRPVDWLYVDANEAFSSLTGLHEVVGKRVLEILPTSREDNPETFEAYGRVAAGGEPEDFEVYFKPLGQWLKISVRCPEPEHFAAIFEDISERKRAEEALGARSKELERSNQELERFAFVASHDLQEPLRMVASYTQLLKKRYGGQLDADADEFIGFAVEGAVRLQGLINDLLEYSRLDSKGREPVPTDSGVVLDEVLRALSKTVADSGAIVTHDSMPWLMVDPSQLGQLFQNLVANAIKFRGESPPEVHIGAMREGPMWRLSVRDNGIGIDSQYFDRVFQIFQRLHSRQDFEGSGIGLAICKRIVERDGGRIWIEATPGEGSTFLYTLPAITKGLEA